MKTLIVAMGLAGLILSHSLPIHAAQLYPDGTYGPDGPYQLMPDGKYAPDYGQGSQVLPNGEMAPRVEDGYRMAPDGSYVPNTPQGVLMTPNGDFLPNFGKGWQMAPDGSYVPRGGPEAPPDNPFALSPETVVAP